MRPLHAEFTRAAFASSDAVRTLRAMKRSRSQYFCCRLAACQPNESKTPPAAGPLTINGAGATFPNPIYSKWFDEYQKSHPDVRINYQPIGSGGGIKQLTAQTVFFGATDGPMTDEQLQAAPGAILHFPTVLGGVVPVYNVPGVTQPLRFSGAVLADIYLGKITKWNDAAIAQINPGVTLPADGHRRRPSLRRLGHDLHLLRLPLESFARVQTEGRRRHLGQLAGRRRREGQRRRLRTGHARRPARSATSS